MTESQSHGFTLQNILFKSIYGATDEELAKIAYIAKMDLPAEYNHIDPGIPISCKVSRDPDLIDMADCLRVYDGISSGKSYHVTLIVYHQDDATKTKKVVEIIEYDLTSSKTELFGTLTREEIVGLDAAIKAVPRGRAPTIAEKAAIYTLRDSLKAKSGAIQLAPKMDSGKQRRLQCSFNKFQILIAAHPDRLIARGPPSAFRGHALSTDTINSGRRVRKPRALELH